MLISGGHGSLAGYKIAVSSKPMQAFVGVDQPIAGALLSTDSPQFDGDNCLYQQNAS
jgi:2-keto-4-pentenoate hydratase